MKNTRNLLAGLTNSVWSALINLAAIPFYLKYLGIEAYGLIGFFVTTQAVLGLLDMGMAPTINREVARYSATDNLQGAGKLLHTLAVVYWSTAAVIVLIITIIAPLISDYWLKSEQLDSTTISNALMLMGLVVACRWPVGLYQGALIGAQSLVLSSSINIVMVTIGSLGAVVVLAFVSPTIEAFFMWQACVGIAYATAMRWGAWRVIGRTKGIKFEVSQLKEIWRFSLGMSGVAISAIILMQLDKVILSKILSLEDFGRYTLAVVVANGLYILLTPTFNVIYPRLTALFSAGDTNKLIDFYRSGTRMFLAVLFPIATAAAVFSNEILTLWTGDPALATSAAPIVSLLLIGTALNGVMHFPYALQLAFGMAQLPLTINAILISAMIPTTTLLALNYGAVGGAAAWVILNAIYLIFGTLITHRFLLKKIGFKWLIADVGMPLSLSILIVALPGNEVRKLGGSLVIEFLSVTGLVLLAFAVILNPQVQAEKSR